MDAEIIGTAASLSVDLLHPPIGSGDRLARNTVPSEMPFPEQMLRAHSNMTKGLTLFPFLIQVSAYAFLINKSFHFPLSLRKLSHQPNYTTLILK